MWAPNVVERMSSVEFISFLRKLLRGFPLNNNHCRMLAGEFESFESAKECAHATMFSFFEFVAPARERVSDKVADKVGNTGLDGVLVSFRAQE